LKGGQQLVDLVVSLGDVPHPDFAVQSIVAATADPLAIDIARLDEVGDDALSRSFSDSDRLGDVPESHVSISSDAKEHLRVV
jgi:hypothetical protein